jgi:hypothetical protein
VDKRHCGDETFLPEDVSRQSSHQDVEGLPSFIPRERLMNEFENRLLSLTRTLQEMVGDLSE